MTQFTTPTKTDKVTLGKTKYTLNTYRDLLGAEGYYFSEEEQGKASTDPIFLTPQQVKALNLLISKKKE